MDENNNLNRKQNVVNSKQFIPLDVLYWWRAVFTTQMVKGQMSGVVTMLLQKRVSIDYWIDKQKQNLSATTQLEFYRQQEWKSKLSPIFRYCFSTILDSVWNMKTSELMVLVAILSIYFLIVFFSNCMYYSRRGSQCNRVKQSVRF